MAEKKQNNADGTVIIDTKINTSGAENDLKKLKQELSQSADTAKTSADKIENAFDGMDVSGAADGLGDSFEKETQKAEDSINTLEDAIKDLPESYQTIYRKIEQIRADDTLDNEQKADKIKDIYEALGQSQKKSQEQAWEAIKNESESGSRKVIDNLDDIAKKASRTGDTLKNKLLDGLDFSSLNGMIDSLSQKLGDMVGGSLGSALGGALGGAVGGAIGNMNADGLTQAAGALVDFGKESITLASDLEEVQNVVDVTFTTMSDDVNKFAQDAMRSAGLSETAAKQYTGTFGAMAKSLGFSEKSVYAMSTSLTQLTGDISSFYNIGHEEAAQKLTAVFTGETESLKELGIVMTQTNLDSYALANGFGKTTAEMTSQEQAALRYQYVLDGLNDAVGDYSRTSDSWANQTKLLSQQWDQLKASVGAVLIEALDPIVSVLNTLVLPVLNLFADALKFVAEHSISLGDVISGTMDLLSSLFTPPEAEIQKRMTDSIDTVTSEVKDLGDAYMDTAGKAAESMEYQIGLFDELSLASDKTSKDVLKNIQTQITAMENYGENIKKLAEYDVHPAIIQMVSDFTEEGMLMAQTLVDGLDETTAQALNDAYMQRQKAMVESKAEIDGVLNALTMQAEKATDEIESNFSDTTDAIGGMANDIQGFIDSLHGTTIDIIFNYQTSGTIPSFMPSGYDYTPSSYTGDYTMPTCIPYLAEGAVIPPNAPFMAVLGDQRHGTNIEAPLETIQDAVRAEIGDQLLITNNLLQQILEKDTDISLDGYKVAEQVTRYQRRMAKARGW